MKISASSSSFQAPVKVKTLTATSPGAESGSTIRNSACKRRGAVHHRLLLQVGGDAAEEAHQAARCESGAAKVR